MRKSAVSVRSGAGMPVHMVGYEMGRCKEERGRGHYLIWGETQPILL